MYSQDEFDYMNQALSLADEAKGKTFPNPAVGAVVVKNGRVIGRGATEQWGGLHAEKKAFASATESCEGADLYVTLEPCCHFGRTPPCTDAVIAAGIKRVYIAVSDPNPEVAGKGISQLENAGILCNLGLCGIEAQRLNEDFFFGITEKKTWVTVKLALTLDGSIADDHYSSQWITNENSRTYVHELRRKHCGIAVGGKTAHYDNPQLTVRHVDGVSPIRFLFSSTSYDPNLHLIANSSEFKTIIVSKGDKLQSEHIDEGLVQWYIPQKQQMVDLDLFRTFAYEQGITSLFVEGGSALVSSFLESGNVNRVCFFYGAKILGSGIRGLSFSKSISMGECITLRDVEHHSFETDFMVTGIVEKKCLLD